MTPGQWADLGLGVVSIILLPFLIMLFRLTIQGTKLVDRVGNIEADLKDSIQNQTRSSEAIYSQMRDDRLANNQRLRWLEENLWKGHNG